MFSTFLLSLLAMVNPTLLAAVTVMMLLPRTEKLMLGYLLGSYLTSIGLGLAVALSLHGTGSAETAQTGVSPLEDLAVGAILVAVGWVVLSGRAGAARERRRERRRAKRGGEEPEERREPWTQRLLGRGSARITFALGAVLSFPGASYLVALDRIARMDLAVPATVATVVGFCVIQLLLLEAPLVGFAVAPEWTEGAVVRFRDWIAVNGVRAGGWVALVLGGLALLRGVLALVL